MLNQYICACERLTADTISTFVFNGALIYRFALQYDPRGGDNRSLFYHHLDKRKRDIFITAIKKIETHIMSFQMSNDHKYLILRESRVVSIANIESLDVKIQFRLILRIFPDVTYVNYRNCIIFISTPE